MDVAVGKRWEPMLDALVEEGRYLSKEEVVAEGLGLVRDTEDRLAQLRTGIALAIAAGGEFSDDEVGAAIEARLAERAHLTD